MKKTLGLLGAAAMLGISALAQTTQPVLPPGQIAVFKAGTPDTNWPMNLSKVAPCFVQVFDPAVTNKTSTNPVVSVAMATNSSVPGSVWINHHAGSEGGGISRSLDRQFLVLEGYVGNILSPLASKPSTDTTVNRGIVTLDAFTNAISVLSTPTGWFGIPLGSATGTQDNPTGICSPDGTNFYGTGNFTAVGTASGELDGTLFYNSDSQNLQEVQQYLQAAGEARIIGGMLLIATKSATGVASGLYNFIDPATGAVVPQPWNSNVANPYYNFAFTNLYLNWGNTFQNVLNFDMDPARTVAYGADQKLGIVKFVNVGGTWAQAPYYFSATNIGTLKQSAANQGVFGICVDFSGANPVIYATTMENGAATNYTGGLGAANSQGNKNNNRLIKIVDTGVSPGTNYVAQTLAIAATTNEFFGGIDFTPDLRPLVVGQTGDYATIVSGSGSVFSVTAQSSSALSYQWYENGTAMNPAASIIPTNSALDLTTLAAIDNYSALGFTNQYQCVITNNYGAVTSSIAQLIVTVNPTAPVITGGTNKVTAFVGSSVTFPAVTATGTQPFTYQWYDKSGVAITDDGVKYSGSTTASLTVSNLVTPDDSTNFIVVVRNPSAIIASNVVDKLTVNYHLATISAGQPQSVTTFLGTPATITAGQSGASAPVSSQWFKGTTSLSEGGEYTGTTTATLSIAATTTADTGNNYYIVYTNPGGSVTSTVATVTVMLPPAHSSVAYSNQVYAQTFDVLPDPGSQGVAAGVAISSGISVNSINNPMDAGIINGLAYSLANPFDFAYPVINSSYIGGLGLTNGSVNVAGTVGSMAGWYGAADTNLDDKVDGITRFGAQPGDQSTGGVIDFGPLDSNGGLVGTNRSLGLLSTSTTGSTAFGLKLINSSSNTLNYVSLSFLGELWRNNKAARTMSFSYAVDPTASSFVLLSEPTATNTDSQVIPGTIRVPNLAFSFMTNDGSVLAFDGTQPTNRVNMGATNMLLSTPWPPGAALWLVWSMNYYGQGSGQGYAIDNLKFSASTLPTTLVQPIKINGVGGAGSPFVITGHGALATAKFSFTNAPGLTFSVRATNNIAAPKATWPVIGTVTDSVTPGLYQFIDPNAATNDTLFYMISEP